MLSHVDGPRLHAFTARRSSSRSALPYVFGVTLALQLVGGCAEPIYREPAPDTATLPDCDRDCDAGGPSTMTKTELPGDASRVQTSEPDSGSANGTTPDAVQATTEDAGAASAQNSASSGAQRLVGDYAVLTRFFGWDATGVGGSFSDEIVSLASIRSASDGKLTMTMQTCDLRGTVNLLVVAPIMSRVVSPEKLPPRHYSLQVAGDTFSTTGPAVAAGYKELAPADCPVGSKQTHPERGWLPGGECTCPTSTLPPTHIDDCRVVDSDGDHEAGLTIDYRGGAENITRTRLRDSSQMVSGVIDAAGKHRASFAPDTGTFHLKCEPTRCTQTAWRVCAPEFNPVHFLPLATRADARAWTCEDVVLEIDGTGQFGTKSTTAPEC